MRLKTVFNFIMENVSREEGGNIPYSKGIPYNVTLHAWPVPKPNETTTFLLTSNESAKNHTITFHNINATGYIADDDLTDTGFTDVQTFILASLATIIPLLITVATLLGVRHIWKRYTARTGEGYKGVIQKDKSTDPSGKLYEYSLAQELKASESQFMPSSIEEETMPSSSPRLLTPKSNGSVITMTLKNNHLIVETEETDASTPLSVKIESIGTSTKFVTSTAPEFNIHKSIDAEISQLSRSIDGPPSSTAQVHHPPSEKEEEDQGDAGSCNTGFSQSDLSESSEESQNPSYRYGNQIGYNSGGYGYPEYMGYSKTHNYSETTSTGLENQVDHFRKSLIKEPSQSEGNFEIKPILLKDVLVSDIQVREEIMKEISENRFKEEKVLTDNEISSADNDIIFQERKNIENILNSEGGSRTASLHEELGADCKS